MTPRLKQEGVNVTAELVGDATNEDSGVSSCIGVCFIGAGAAGGTAAVNKTSSTVSSEAGREVCLSSQYTQNKFPSSVVSVSLTKSARW